MALIKNKWTDLTDTGTKVKASGYNPFDNPLYNNDPNPVLDARDKGISIIGDSSVKPPETSGGGKGDGTADDPSNFSFRNYIEAPDVTKARNEMNAFIASKPADWTGGTYGASLNDALNKILNREQFSYDLNGDALYQQYKDKFINQGRLAMHDALGQASGLTGGYGNSYAATVGNQAYQGELQKLNNVIPDLYQLAFSVYNQEGQNLLNNYNAVNTAYNQEYGQWRDSVGDWYTEANRLANAYENAYGMDYGRYADDFNRALQTHQQNQSNTRYAEELALEKAKYDATSTKDDYASKSQDYEDQIADLTERLNSKELNDKYGNAENVKKFRGYIMNEREFSRHRSGNVFKTTVDGKAKTFDSYEQYVDEMLEKYYKELNMSEGEVAYLKGYYGIGAK